MILESPSRPVTKRRPQDVQMEQDREHERSGVDAPNRTKQFEMRKADLIKRELDVLHQNNDIIESVMSSLKLPTILNEQVEGLTSLPDDVKTKAGAVRKVGGVDEIPKLLSSIRRREQSTERLISEMETRVKSIVELEEEGCREFEEGVWQGERDRAEVVLFKTHVDNFREALGSAQNTTQIHKDRFNIHRRSIEILSQTEGCLKASVLGDANEEHDECVRRLDGLVGDVQRIVDERQILETELTTANCGAAYNFVRAVTEGHVDRDESCTAKLQRIYAPIQQRCEASLQHQHAVFAEIETWHVKLMMVRQKLKTRNNDVAVASVEEKFKELVAAADAFDVSHRNLQAGLVVDFFYNGIVDRLRNMLARMEAFESCRREMLQRLRDDPSTEGRKHLDTAKAMQDIARSDASGEQGTHTTTTAMVPGSEQTLSSTVSHDDRPQSSEEQADQHWMEHGFEFNDEYLDDDDVDHHHQHHHHHDDNEFGSCSTTPMQNTTTTLDSDYHGDHHDLSMSMSMLTTSPRKGPSKEATKLSGDFVRACETIPFVPLQKTSNGRPIAVQFVPTSLAEAAQTPVQLPSVAELQKRLPPPMVPAPQPMYKFELPCQPSHQYHQYSPQLQQFQSSSCVAQQPPMCLNIAPAPQQCCQPNLNQSRCCGGPINYQNSCACFGHQQSLTYSYQTPTSQTCQHMAPAPVQCCSYQPHQFCQQHVCGSSAPSWQHHQYSQPHQVQYSSQFEEAPQHGKEQHQYYVPQQTTFYI